MAESPRHSWLPSVALAGIAYAAVGIAFAIPVTHVRAWRLAAWVVSAVVYGTHIAYERIRLQVSPGWAALHVALAVAIGAFGLAVGANIHSLSASAPNQHRHLLLLALLIWPVVTAVPAYVVALGASALVARR